MALPPEYVTDVPYVRGFEKYLSPTRLRLCATLAGFRAPSGDDFDYCELGCAQADTLVAVAASHPEARFVGVDLNAAHIAAGRTLAEGADVRNVRFIQGDFEELSDEDLPHLDYVVAHGVLSWVGPHKRKVVLDLMSRRLKDGGLAYVSYNALPGWAPIEPLRQLILAGASLSRGNSEAGARAGVDLASALDAAGAYFFEANPAVKKMLTTLKAMGPAYVAHEYLHAHWVPMYFAQVAAEMAERELYFVGQLPAYLNYRDLAIPQSLDAVFRSVGDRLTFEGLKDYALNTYFRTDVFVKGRSARDEVAAREAFDTTPFGVVDLEPSNAREAMLPNHTLRFNGPVYDALLRALAEGAVTFHTLAQRPDLASYESARVRDALLHLVLADRLCSLREPPRPASEVGQPSIPSAYNRWILARGFTPDVPIILASPVAGNGVPLSMVDAAGLRAALEPNVEKRRQWLEAFCHESLTHLVVGGRRVDDMHELIAIVTDQAERFRTLLPKLVELGIVTTKS
jgi:SAM-dependent methyltransferase